MLASNLTCHHNRGPSWGAPFGPSSPHGKRNDAGQTENVFAVGHRGPAGRGRSRRFASALPKTVLVGLPEAAVKESTHRVERAIVNSGFLRPQDRIVINLAPAELPKQAASFDLPITLGILAGSGQIESDLFDQYAVVGELALEGNTRPARGALSMAMAAAQQEGLRGLVVPSASAAEAAVVEDIEVIPVASLSEAVGFFTGELEIEPTPSRLDELFRRAVDLRRRFRRRPRPGDGQAGHDHRRRRRPQSADDRSARLRQDDAGQTGADDLARR